MAVRSASQGSQPVTTNQAQLAFVRVFCGPTNKCVVPTSSLASAHIDTTTKPAIIFRIAAKNSKGYGPATQVSSLKNLSINDQSKSNFLLLTTSIFFLSFVGKMVAGKPKWNSSRG